jgi:hypothetical protein
MGLFSGMLPNALPGVAKLPVIRDSLLQNSLGGLYFSGLS